jgi:hypothetical protein
MLRTIVNSQIAVCSFARHSVENSSTILRTRAGGALHHGEPYLPATVDWILCRAKILCSSDSGNFQQLSRVAFENQLLFRFRTRQRFDFFDAHPIAEHVGKVGAKH